MKRLFGLLMLFTLFAAREELVCAEQGEFTVTVESSVAVTTRDGVRLIADVYRPNGQGPFPVLLQRTPYDRKGGASMAEQLASHGYIVVIQDTRGRFESDGEFYPFRHETDDGFDTVEWAAKLPGSNGKVGMFGGSYVGATQMLAAIGKPPHLEAIFPYVTAAEYYDGWTYQSGVLMQWFASSWTTGLATDTLRKATSARSRPKDWAFTIPVDQYRILDVPSAHEVAPYFRDWIVHETDDAYWKPWKISDRYSEMTVKALHGAGWHDIFSKGSIRNYIGLREKARTVAARDGQRLIVGPWAHAATSPEGKIGGVVYGKQAVLDMPGATLEWFDYALKDVQNRYATGKPIRLFVLGENAWREEEEFPPKRANETRFYLAAQKGANSAHGDGVLVEKAPENSPPDVFDYDPWSPVPTIGGRLCCGTDVIPPGPFDQSPNETRRDVLVYSTPPLDKELEATGWVKVELYASTTAADTDFTAMLVDVDSKGFARYLADGIVRARYRNSTEQAEPIVPGKPYRYEVDLWATSNLFKVGHRVRLYISSSNFPRFNRNPNTGERMLGTTGMVKARQTIYHDATHPSALVLPVVAR